jgi:hypothetical protein
MEQILQTNGAVGVELLGLAPMVQRVHACTARVAVDKLVVAFHPANAALVAVVVISLNAIIKKVAHCAKVCGEPNAATFVRACLGHRLSGVARSTYQFFDCMAVHFVRFGVVVAVTAYVCLVAAWGHQQALAHIVLTTYIEFCIDFIVDCIVLIVHISSVQYKQCIIIHLNDFREYIT